ncbi:MAG: zinc ribbon domain-containing protein [Geobacteraceae bacterium]
MRQPVALNCSHEKILFRGSLTRSNLNCNTISGQIKHSFIFRGLIRCGHCGCAMVDEINNGKYILPLYRESWAVCREKEGREEELIRQFGRSLADLSMDDDVIAWIIQQKLSGF